MGDVIEVVEARGDHFHWIEQQLDTVLSKNARGFVALRGGLIAGMVGFDNWSGNSCRMTVAFTRPMALRRLLPVMFDYPFRHAGRTLVWTMIPAHSRAVLALADGLGFSMTRVMDDGGEDPLMLFEMRRNDCRWLEG